MISVDLENKEDFHCPHCHKIIYTYVLVETIVRKLGVSRFKDAKP